MTTTEQASAEPALESRESILGWLWLGLALALGFTTLGIAIWDEPLHIDELRQVGYYTRDIRGIIDGALSQTQPPLDYLIGAVVQEVLWPADAVWRLAGFGFGWLGLALIGGLFWKSRFSGWLAVGLLALMPVFLEFSSYARPYALPFFLMMAAAWGFDRWRLTLRVPYLALGGLAVLALPLSRTTEPPLFLFLTLVTVITVRLIQGKEQGKWTWPPLVLTVLGLAGSIAVLPAVETTRFRTEGGLNGPGVILSRLWSEILPVHIAQAPLGVVGLIVGLAGIVAAAWLVFRKSEIALWWLVPVTFTALGTPVVFAALSVPTQPYFERYAYFTAPALVLGVAVLLGFVRSSKLTILVGLLVLLVGSTSAISALTEVHRPDFKQASDVSRPLIDDGNVVLYEQDTTIAAFRSGAFPGVPIYIPRSHAVIATELSASEELVVESGRRPLILVLALRSSVDGWTEVVVGDQFHMLIPEHDAQNWDSQEQASALWLACEGFPPETGSYLCVTAVAILYRAGYLDTAEAYADITLDRIQNPVVKARVSGYLEDISTSLIS